MADMRLIDANAMRNDWLENGENECVYDTNAVLDSIDAQPTIDPETLRPVGQWEPFIEDVEIYNTGGFTERKQTGWICGRCKSKESITPYYKTRYCPHCGARMKGENDAK